MGLNKQEEDQANFKIGHLKSLTLWEQKGER
jgi:hypothetical protein